MKRILATTILALLASSGVAFAGTTCADGGVAIGAACHTSTACSSAVGVSFSGQCIAGASTAVTANTPQLNRCGNTNPICAGGAPTTIGCTADSQCPSGSVCVTSSGQPGCGTAASQCIAACSDSTTTTTSSTTSTTSTSTTSTSA